MFSHTKAEWCQTDCSNYSHLIADHIGWFNSDDLTQGGKYKTIEALMASKGHMVKRGSISEDGKEGETIEMYEDEEPVSNGAPDGTAAG